MRDQIERLVDRAKWPDRVLPTVIVLLILVTVIVQIIKW